MSDIRVGDVCLDIVQGTTVQVMGDTGQTAAEWSEENDYDLTENYGNSRAGASESDRVFDVVYAGNARSEPSKDYAFPESRLLRLETEAANDGVRVQDVLAERLLARLMQAVPDDNSHPDLPTTDQLGMLARDAGISDDVLEMARSRVELDAADEPDDTDEDSVDEAEAVVRAAADADEPADVAADSGPGELGNFDAGGDSA